MRAMTESAVRLAREALAVGERALPRYSARTSRHDDTQAQLFALRVLGQFLECRSGASRCCACSRTT